MINFFNSLRNNFWRILLWKKNQEKNRETLFTFQQQSRTPFNLTKKNFKIPIFACLILPPSSRNFRLQWIKKLIFPYRYHRENWLFSDQYQMLLFTYINNYREYIRGIEVESMIYIYPKCKQCKSQCIFPEFVTRAKVSLILSSFQYCENQCK